MNTETPIVNESTQENSQSVPFIDQKASAAPVMPLPWYEKYKAGILLISIVATLILGSVIFSSRTPKKITPPPVPTPTPFPTPTPDRKLSPLSGLQEFRDLDAAVSSFSAHLDRVTLDDPSLVPPVLVLPLGFQN